MRYRAAMEGRFKVIVEVEAPDGMTAYERAKDLAGTLLLGEIEEVEVKRSEIVPLPEGDSER